ncbi:hypothetical protein BKA70DRAFT_1228845 [Coprinopsis sp. MPI-PUGE-AT-0042]|nr:hypothetical protein BKA70DRAFT_1228845 [Coprinopsis sp. MPI-PUGE-AT-0042]
MRQATSLVVQMRMEYQNSWRERRAGATRSHFSHLREYRCLQTSYLTKANIPSGTYMVVDVTLVSNWSLASTDALTPPPKTRRTPAMPISYSHSPKHSPLADACIGRTGRGFTSWCSAESSQAAMTPYWLLDTLQTALHSDIATISLSAVSSPVWTLGNCLRRTTLGHRRPNDVRYCSVGWDPKSATTQAGFKFWVWWIQRSSGLPSELGLFNRFRNMAQPLYSATPTTSPTMSLEDVDFLSNGIHGRAEEVSQFRPLRRDSGEDVDSRVKPTSQRQRANVQAVDGRARESELQVRLVEHGLMRVASRTRKVMLGWRSVCQSGQMGRHSKKEIVGSRNVIVLLLSVYAAVPSTILTHFPARRSLRMTSSSANLSSSTAYVPIDIPAIPPTRQTRTSLMMLEKSGLHPCSRDLCRESLAIVTEVDTMLAPSQHTQLAPVMVNVKPPLNGAASSS